MSLRHKVVSGEIGATQPESAELAHQAAHLAHFRRKGEPDTVTREKARAYFLDIYARVAPGLLRELCETVLPSYPEAARVGIKTEVGRRILREGRAAFNPEYVADAESPIDLWPAVQADRPRLANALSGWARKFFLTFRGEPAGWAMDTALETLRAWKKPKRPNEWWVWPWKHPVGEIHEVYPAGDPAFHSVTGESEAQLDCLSISPWNRPGGETKAQFRKRARRAVDGYIRQMEEWTGRPDKKEWWHFYALGLWQGEYSLSNIRNTLATDGLSVGSGSDRPGRVLRGARGADLSVISHGIGSAAAFIEIDRRPA